MDSLNNPLAQLGFLNSFRTGNAMIDMAMAMLVPLLFQALFAMDWRKLANLGGLAWLFQPKKQRFERRIVYSTTTNGYGGSDGDFQEERNNILQKAICIYVSTELNLKIDSGAVTLSAVKEQGTMDNNTYSVVYGSTADQLKSYSVNTVPAANVWVDVAPGVKFCKQVEQTDEQGEKKNTIRSRSTVLLFRSEDRNGAALIDNFVSTAFKWYQAEMEKIEDSGRYLYALDGGKGDGGSSLDSDHTYKRYLLSEGKTFNSMFFPEKESILSLLSDFTEKKGKYRIEGFPHKLGLLLHGPPGTGKTSLIKAMAAHTKRNIVNIPLARIKTNQELMDMVFGESFPVKGEELPVKLHFRDTIFVLEDVDAASPIVLSRAAQKQEKRERKEEKEKKKQSKKKKEESKKSKKTVEVKEAEKEKEKEKEKEASRVEKGEEVEGEGSALPDAPPLRRTESTQEGEKTREASLSPSPSPRATEGACVVSDVDSDDDEKEDKEDELSDSEDDDDDDDDDDDEDDDMVMIGPMVEGEGTAGPRDDMLAILASCFMGGGEKEGKGKGSGGGGGGGSLSGSQFASKTDKLDLAGVLNVLDGVVETPERIVILTSNHPEKLDPALVRPGRINRKIHLGYMTVDNVAQMIKHYFEQDLDLVQRERLERLFRDAAVGDTAAAAAAAAPGTGAEAEGGPQFTPAVVEQLCAENDTVEQMVSSLCRLHDISLAFAERSRKKGGKPGLQIGTTLF